MTLLSLLWLGLLLVFVRCPCLRLPLWASTCVGPHGCLAFSRVGTAPSPWVPLLWTWFSRESSTVFLLLCLPSGCGHPLGSLVSFVTIDRQRRFPLEKVFFCVVASHFGVVSLFSYILRRFVLGPCGWCPSFYLAGHCTCQYPSSPGFLCCLAR